IPPHRGGQSMWARSEPSYLGNDLRTVGGDLIELKRHVSGLLDDLTFCTEHNFAQALQRFDGRVHNMYEGVERRGIRGLAKARGLTRRHPVTALLALGTIGLGIGLVVGHSRKPDSQA